MGYTFDGATKTIALTVGTTSFDADDLYSRWKDWVLAGTGAPWPEAFDDFGGNELGGGVLAGDYFMLQDGWTILPQDADHTLIVTGNIYPQTPGTQMFAERSGRTIQIQLSRSSLTQTIAVGSGVLPADVTAIGAEVESRILSDGIAFPGARIDAAITTRATPADVPSAATVRDAILSDATRIAGADVATMAATVATNLDAPVSEAGGLTAEQATQLLELWRLMALDPSVALTVAETYRRAGAGIQQTIAEAGGVVTVTRDP